MLRKQNDTSSWGTVPFLCQYDSDILWLDIIAVLGQPVWKHWQWLTAQEAFLGLTKFEFPASPFPWKLNGWDGDTERLGKQWETMENIVNWSILILSSRIFKTRVENIGNTGHTTSMGTPAIHITPPIFNRTRGDKNGSQWIQLSCKRLSSDLPE